MFNFFIQNRNKEMQSLAEIIAVDMAKLNQGLPLKKPC